MGSANVVNLQATVSSVVPTGTKSPLRIASAQALRQNKALGAGVGNTLATDLASIVTAFNALQSAAQSSQNVQQILLTNPAGQVVAALGNFLYGGVLLVNYFSELHVCNPQNSTDPTGAVFNANLDGSVSIGNNGWFDVHDPYDGNAAWIGTQNDTVVITDAVNNGAGAIRLTVPGHTLITGNIATVRAMNLYSVPNANGTWVVTVIDASTVDLQNSIWSGPFQPITDTPGGIPTYQPTIDRVLQIVGASSSGGGLIELETSIPHTYLTGDQINVPFVGGVPAAIGQWIIAVVDSTHFTLDDSVFAGVFTAGGTCLRYFAGLLAETIAIGESFQNFKLRAFADGSLVINNATITLIDGANSIILDPSSASIVATSPSGVITISATTNEITLASTADLSKIVLNAATPSITLYDSAGSQSITIDSNGTITAANIAQTGAFTGTATVRNAAGTGTSSFTFVGGICTAFTP